MNKFTAYHITDLGFEQGDNINYNLATEYQFILAVREFNHLIYIKHFSEHLLYLEAITQLTLEKLFCALAKSGLPFKISYAEILQHSDVNEYYPTLGRPPP